MTNREYMINLLLDGLEENGKEFQRVTFDDGGSSEEAMIHYNIHCPYYNGDQRAHCNNRHEINRETCVTCKMEWLDLEVDL